MTRRLDLFIPPEKPAQQPPEASSTFVRVWFICLIIGGGLKVYLCSPFSIGMGAKAYAQEKKEEKKSEPLSGKPIVEKPGDDPSLVTDKSKGDQAAKPNDPNPLLIGLDEVKILQELKKRRLEIESNSATQEKRQQELKILNDIMQKNIADLTQIKASLDSQSKALQKEPQEALQKMAKLYEGMKPAQAAKILEDMDTPVVAQIMALMKKQIAAGVMASLSDKKARSVTMQTLKMKQEKKA